MMTEAGQRRLIEDVVRTLKSYRCPATLFRDDGWPLCPECKQDNLYFDDQFWEIYCSNCSFWTRKYSQY